MSAVLLMLAVAVLVTGMAVIAGICFLGYFLYKKREEKKQEKEINQ